MIEHDAGGCYTAARMALEDQADSTPTPQAVVEQSVVNYFCRLADMVGLPRSVAQIYAVLFLSPEPLSFAAIVEQSGLSKGSASTGLRHLQRLRGVDVQVRPSDRRSYYEAETSLRRLVSGLLADTVEPSLNEGRRILDQAAEAAETDGVPEHLRARVGSLSTWHQRAGDLLPTLNALSGG